jgi:hypothetical protein
MCQVAPNYDSATLVCVPGIGVGSLDVEALSMVPEGGSEVPIPPQHMVVVAEQWNGSLSCMCRVAPNHVCDTGCIPGT